MIAGAFLNRHSKFMPGIHTFDTHANEYEQWFVDHPLAYLSELHAVRDLLPKSGNGIEIGVGTGRFAAPLGIKKGIEPSGPMAELARRKGVDVTSGVAENLPFRDGEFDFALMVTTICFLDDMDLALGEAFRVLRPGGLFLIGFIDRQSTLGREYMKRKDKSAFYRDATFYSVREIVEPLAKAGFVDFAFRQTIFGNPGDMEKADPVKEGHGKGAFVVVRGVKGG